MSVSKSILELPSANVSMVPEVGSAVTKLVDAKRLKTIKIARLTEREALACARVHVRGIEPADDNRGLSRLRRKHRKNINNKSKLDAAMKLLFE